MMMVVMMMMTLTLTMIPSAQHPAAAPPSSFAAAASSSSSPSHLALGRGRAAGATGADAKLAELVVERQLHVMHRPQLCVRCNRNRIRVLPCNDPLAL
mmetsp:Transcript_40075/g.61604  ORF Transcript_40075/g.61604 Transcript_40075/m.61604 type:complete len:98 (+) Transcript_40075:1-294(+)